ncbi:MAG TPA: PilX N-terminal domain-containing pilus assembly protein [Gammaproteobacteria bacterium]|jgi:type IV pilus assembly protein PilX|nr:PilX N-terminal domain-containing pilus assembly protein [Gammaproteobacteria bacterium]
MNAQTPLSGLRNGLPRSQRGATLVVGLVLLLVLTVVGVSGMNTATMEVAMAANAQYQADAFQATEGAADTVIATRNYSTNGTTTLPWTNAVDLDRSAQTTYRGNTIVPDAAFSAGEVEAFHFDIQSWGRASRNAASNQIQSFYVIGRAL